MFQPLQRSSVLVRRFAKKSVKWETIISARGFSTNMEASSNYRLEKDSLGEVQVPSNRLWGAQTQRSLDNFKIASNERMPVELIRALAMIKLAAARVNAQSNKLPLDVSRAIETAAKEVLDGKWNEEFPLVVWQTGSGTQTNMNSNEVIANRAIQLMGGVVGSKSPVHPNDHVNLGQSSNDTFPTAMHIAACVETRECLLPALSHLQKALKISIDKFSPIIKMGRTHLQDATPLSLGQEFSGFESMVSNGLRRIESSLDSVYELAQGGTAVGTGINTYKGFAESFATEVAAITKLPFKTSPNKFESLGGVGPMVELSSALSTTAADMLKIANDIRLLSSGPRSGFNELLLPANEPGSSIMPGKVNPTQCEALSMVCAEVIGNHTAVLVSSTHGHLQLNVFRPVIIFNILRSIRLLSDSIRSFTDNCITGIVPNEDAIAKHLENSLMLVTSLTPHIGYDKSAKIALYAHHKNLSLEAGALELGYISSEDFDRYVCPKDMISPSD